jgi:hypothetical protein
LTTIGDNCPNQLLQICILNYDDMKNKDLFLLKLLTPLFIGILLILSSCEKDDDQKDNIIVVSGTGDITQKVNEFRQLLGEPLNTTPGQTAGRREINWDGVPDEFATQSLPRDFFNNKDAAASNGLKRGFLYAIDGDFRISADGFTSFESSNGTQFKSFSGGKVFANVSSSRWPALFEVAGTATPAFIKGFGAVFSDVDLSNNSFIEVFNGNTSLGRFYVPPHDGNSSFSFLGVYMKNDRITRVEIGHGGGKLESGGRDISNGGTDDLVVLDDFLFDEPKQQ